MPPFSAPAASSTAGDDASAPAVPGVEALCRRADELFSDRGAVTRWMMRTRPRICPFEWVLGAVPPGGRVLDIGCGRGLLAGLLSSFGRANSGVGVDVSEDVLTEARAATDKAGGGWRFVCAREVEAWPEEAFDVVTMLDVMHHLPKDMRPEAIRAAASRLNPGGRLVFKDMADSPWWAVMMARLHDLTLVREWAVEEPIENVERWADEAGLELVESKAGLRWWYAHELRVFVKPGGEA